MSYKHPKPWKDGDHLIICDVCGRQVYRSEADYRWDGILACLKFNCWDEKHAIFEVPPVINDPRAIYDVRPDQSIDNVTYVDQLSGLVSTWDGVQLGLGSDNGNVTWDSYNVKWDEIDNPPSYI